MKTTRSNSFRLHRISKTNSLKKTFGSQSIHTDDLPFKLEAINSINKGVKYNDLSFITGRDHLNKLRKQPTIQTDFAFQSAHSNMNQMRKKFDDTKKKTLLLEESILKLKEEKQKYETKDNQFNNGKNKGKQKVESMQKDLESKKNLLEVTQTEKKVLQGIISRYKTDKIFYDQSKFNLEQEYSHLKKQLKIFLKEGTQIGQNSDRTIKVYEKFMKQLDAEKKQRDQHISNTENILMNKVQVLEANDARGLQIQEIAERAMQDKNMSEKQWQKIFLTHTFLSKMLRNKIQRQMQKFRTVQFSFKQIKTATGVNEAQVLVSKYLKKEQVYGQLLSKISSNEKLIQQLKSQTDSLLAEEKKLQTEKEMLQNTKIIHSDLHDVIKGFQSYQEKKLTCQLLSTKLFNWLERNLKKFQLFDKKPGGYSKENRTASKLIGFYSEKLSDSLLKISESLIQQPQLLGSNLQNEKLVRIQPRKARKSSIGQQIYDVDEQETNLSNLTEQLDMVALQREQVLKTNEKFMKQLKKKREQLKKTLIEAMQKAIKQKQKPKVQIKKQE